MGVSKRQPKDKKDIPSLMDSLKGARDSSNHVGAVREITELTYSQEKAQQFLVYLASYTFGFSDDYNIVLASWGLLDGIGPNLGSMERRTECAKQFGYNESSLSSIEIRCYKEIKRQLLKNGFVIDEEKLNERARIQNKNRRERFIAEMFSGKFDIQVPARPYRVNDAITKGKDKTGLIYPGQSAYLNEINVVPRHAVQNPDKVPSFPLAESPNIRFMGAGGSTDLLSKLEKDLADLQYSDRRVLELEPRANTGDVDAQYELGELYCKKREHEKAKKWFLAAAEQNHVVAQIKLGTLFVLHPEWEDAAVNALYWAEKAALQGDSYAQYLAGHCYHYGVGAERDYSRAAEYYKRSLDQGVNYAANNLGLLYLYGLGVAQDYAEALRLFKITFDDGVIAAAHNIGTVYRLGSGPARDIKTAIEWFKVCAESGYIPSQVTLGMIYYHGDGIEIDYRLSSYWFKKAADQGDANAQYFLGYSYLHQLGVDQDYDKGFYWLSKSAEQGHPLARVTLGQCYANGIGTEPNAQEAIKWFKLAAETHSEVAEKEAEIIEALKGADQ